MRRKLRRLAGASDGDPAPLVVERAYAALARAPSRLVVATLDDASLAERRPNMPGDVATAELVDPAPAGRSSSFAAIRFRAGSRPRSTKRGSSPGSGRRCRPGRGNTAAAAARAAVTACPGSVADRGDARGECQIEGKPAHLNEDSLGERLPGGDPAVADENERCTVIEDADRLVGA